MNELLLDAYNLNIQNGMPTLAKETVKVMKSLGIDVSELEKKIPIPKNFDLGKSSIDWENHVNFGLAGSCFVCRRPFIREESKMMGIGPVCGGWGYSFDPRLKINKSKLEKVKRTVRERMLKGSGGKYQYSDLIEYIAKMKGEANISIIRETEKAIQIDINGIHQDWIPRKTCVYYFGAFFVQTWKVKEILGEMVRKGI